jgi:hypothetical protein
VRSRTAGVMTTLMRNGRDRRSENPFWADAILERVQLSGTDQRITSGPAATAAASHGGNPPSENRPDTWLHPNASQRSQIFPLHRGRRPYMAQTASSRRCSDMAAVDGTPDAGLTRPLPPLLPSRPGEFHPEPLTDPDLNLSVLPARVTARRLPSAEPSGSFRCDLRHQSSTELHGAG